MRFDLHIHSKYSSDSSLDIDNILKKAVKEGLDGIAICDHNTASGSFHARKRAKDLALPLIVIPGIEVSTAQGHLLVLGVRDNIQPDLSIQETIRIAKQKGGVVIAAHPFKKRESIGWVAGMDIDAVETFNSRCIFGENDRAKEMAQALHIPEVGGSDSHLLSTIGLGYTDIEADPDEKSVISAIREGRTKSGGRITPLSGLCIIFMRSALRKLQKTGKDLHSKIFHENRTI